MILEALALALQGAPPSAPSQPVTIVAHRGLAEGVAENTLAAFRQSIERGVAVIELDLRVTSDGQPVVIHDKTLDRTTNCSGPVVAMTRARIEICDAGGGEHVPSFAEVLALVRDKPVRILADIKDGTPLEAVIRDVRAQDQPRLILGLRRAKDVARVRAELPQATTLAFMREIEDAPSFAASGVHIIRLWSDWIDADPTHIGRVKALGPEVWIMVGRNLPRKRRDWRSLHSRMSKAGADGIITDRPELVGP